MSLFSSLLKNMFTGCFMRTAVILLILIPFSLNVRSQGISNSEDKAPSWRYQPPAATASPTVDTRTPAEISFEDKYFDTYTGAADPLDGPQHRITGLSGHGVFDEDFPASFRDEVFVAHFSTWVSHLSSSRRSIYTTINLQVDRVVSDKDGHMSEGSVIPFIIPGGTALAPGTQKVLSYFIRAGDFPLEPDTEYLIFLDRQPQLPFYEYVKAWRVEKGVLEPVTKFDSFRISQGRSTHGGTTLESAIRELMAH